MVGSDAFKLNSIGNFEYFSIPAFDSAGKGNIFTFFSSRNGGVSRGPYSSFNLGTKKQDDINNVEKNYEILCSRMNLEIDSFVFSDQIHRDNVKRVGSQDAGFPLHGQKVFNTDALITDVRDLPLITFHADCVPLYFFDPENVVIGLAHAGWRGTVMRIGQKMIREMVKEFGTRPGKLLVAIGPSIGRCCYEVGQDVFEPFLNEFGQYNSWYKKKKNKYMLDLQECNRLQLLEMGVDSNNIYISNLCTSCDKKHFYSYRRDGKTGIHGAVIMIR